MPFSLTVGVDPSNYQHPPWVTVALIPSNLIAINSEPRNLQIVPWAILAEPFEHDIDSIPFPDGYPYVDIPNLDPGDGESSVELDTDVIIPCGDVLRPSDDVVGIDAFTGEPSYTIGSGLNDTDTIIRAKYGAGSWTIVYQNGAAQNSWVVTGPANLINGFTYTLTPPSPLPPITEIFFEVGLVDLQGQSAFYDEYSFLTGTAGPEPYIDSNSPTGTISDLFSNIFFSTKDPGGGVVQNTISCTVNGQDAIINGVFQTGWDGPGSLISANAYDGYDVVIDPVDQFAVFNTYTVYAYCEDNELLSAELEWDFYITTATVPYLVSVTPVNGVLDVLFSEPMMKDIPLSRITSYLIEQIRDAKILIITGVTIGADGIHVYLTYKGGGGTYKLTAVGVRSKAGAYIDPDRDYAFFTLEIEEGIDNYFFETNLGAIHLEIENLSKRSIEDLVVRRVKNVGHDEQLKLVSDALRNAGISRDNTRLKIFKG